MEAVIKAIRDWSELWALLIPLTILLCYRNKTAVMKPVKVYIWVGLALSMMSTTLFVFHDDLPKSLQNNNHIYNIHSLARVLIFSWFFRQFRFGRKTNFHNYSLALYLCFVAVNFTFWDSPMHFSNTHFIAESIIMLVFSVFFFLRCIQDDSEIDWIKQPAFIVCAGICLYEAINFFTFLFFETLSIENIHFLKITWTIHNMCYVILCSMFAIALYRSREQVKTRLRTTT